MALVYAETVIPGAAGYAPGDALFRAWESGQVARAWRLGNRLVSIKLTPALGGGVWKNSDRFVLPDPEKVLRELSAVGIEHPSSWGDCYHQLAEPLPRIPWTYNGLLEWWPGGPWAEARKTGEHKGTWWRYDLRGAYRWAARLGLPDPATFSITTRRGDRAGIWVVRSLEDRPDLPSVFQRAGDTVVISSEEIERYNFQCDTIRGITWEKELPADYVERTLRRIPYPKEVARAYWGRWIARDRLTCWTPNREWSLPNVHTNFAVGFLIVSRVRWRVWEVSHEAAHVYVDEVLIPHELPTGGEGEWGLKEIYPVGVVVHRTGHYQGCGAPSPVMQTGVAKS